MALADFAAYKALYKNPQLHNWYINWPTVSAAWPLASVYATSNVQYPALVGGSTILTAPTTAAALGAASTGAWVKPVGGSGDQIIVGLSQVRYAYAWGGVLIDRLSHQGGLSGTVTTAQTTNLPTAALTRYTSGVGVYAALEVYTAVGATDALWTVSYTNQAGTAGRTASWLMADTPGGNSFHPIPLVGSDTGVRSVESVTLTPSTGTAGNFGVTLFKPLVWFGPHHGGMDRPFDIFSLPGWNTPIDDDAFLQVLTRQAGDGGQSTEYTFMFGES